MQEKKVVLEVKGLSKRFGQFQAVQDLSFSVYEGDVYGFLGQNGAGKSTTLRMLLTLIRPDSGEIRVWGENLGTRRSHILRRIGAVIEKPDLYKYLSAWDNLQLFARLSGMRPSRAQLQEKLELVGLADRAEDIVRTFSQGMKQRLGIAVSLINDPDLIILDEPTNGLDPQGIADIRNLILHLSREQGKTLIVSSHLLYEMERIASRMLIIDKGRKVREGEVGELFDPSDLRVTIQVTDPERALELINNSPYASGYQGQEGTAIVMRLHRDDIPMLNRLITQADIGVIRIDPRYSLEDYFLRLTSANQHVDPFIQPLNPS